MNNSTMPLGEKIREIRKAKGLSLENMALAVGSFKANVSRIERGMIEITPQMLTEIRKFLEIEAAPLSEQELHLYRSRIWVWNDLIESRRIDDAKSMQREMAVILDLPFEHDLYALYHAMEVCLLCKEYNFSDAGDKLKALEGLLDNPSDELLNLYYRSKGLLSLVAGDKINCLKHSFSALDYAEKCKKADVSALINLGQAYAALRKPCQAIIYLERAKIQFKDGAFHNSHGHINAMLGVCYGQIGEKSIARKMFETALVQAKSVNNEFTLGMTLSNMSFVSFTSGNYEEAISLCDQARPYVEKDGVPYAVILTTKALCLLSLGELDKCREVVTLAKSVLERKINLKRSLADSKNIAIHLEAIGHLMTLDNSDSVKYILEVAIPQFRAGSVSKLTIIDLCNRLEAHFIKRRAKTKANGIAAVARDIYREMYWGEVEF